METITLSNGQVVQRIGIGSWNFKNDPEGISESIKTAVELGYRFIDTAWIYDTEELTGKAIAASIAAGVVKREDLIIGTKLWNCFHRQDLVRGAVEDSLNKLGLDYVDIFYIHWPVAFKEDAGPQPRDENGKFIFSDSDYMDTYKALEECVDAGIIKSIGLSNLNSKQLQRVLDNCRIKPLAIQLEIHPYLTNERMVQFCQEKGITVIAYSPFGAPARTWRQGSDPSVLEEPLVKRIAGKVKHSPGQVLIRYLLQRNLLVLVKSTNPKRIKENKEVFDFSLSEEDMKEIASLNKNTRAYLIELWADSKFYPWHEDF